MAWLCAFNYLQSTLVSRCVHDFSIRDIQVKTRRPHHGAVGWHIGTLIPTLTVYIGIGYR